MGIAIRFVIPAFAAAGAVAATLAAPSAVAAPDPTLPQCVDTGGAAAIGGSTTECSTPGNTSIDATPGEQEFVGPWGDMWGGDGLFFP
jgi:hypothetical protein